MKNIIRSQKGAITLFVLVSMLFMAMFLMTIFTLSTNNEIASRNAIKALKEEYEVGLDKIDEIYNSLLNVRAFDKDGNEIENIEISLCEYSPTTKGFRVEYTGNIKPYYMIAGDKEAKITEYLKTIDEVNGITKKQLKLEGAEISKNTDIRTIIGQMETDTEVVTDFTIGENNKLTTSMNQMFSNLTNLENIDLGNLDISNVTSMSLTFYGCTKLKTITFAKNKEISSLTSMYAMFRDCKALTSIDLSDFDTSKVTTMSNMFYGCSALTELDLSNLVTRENTTTESMFRDCSKLTKIIGLTKDTLNPNLFSTNKMKVMYAMFSGCSSLTELDVTKFDTSNATNMSRVFENCSSLTELDLSNFNTSNSTQMWSMFLGCSKLPRIIGLTESTLNPNFVTNKVTSIHNMFYGCNALTELSVSNFNTSNVTDMYDMFWSCYRLTKIDGLCSDNLNENFVTNKVTSMYRMFCGCNALKELNLSYFSTESLKEKIEETSSNKYNEAIKYTKMMFCNCIALKELVLGEKFIINNPLEVEITTGYTKDENGNKIGGTTSVESKINSMLQNCNSNLVIKVHDDTTREILESNFTRYTFEDISI